MVTLEDVNVQEFVKKDGTASAKLVGRVMDLQLSGGGEQKEEASRNAVPAVQKAAPAKKAPSSFDDMDSDIPF
jgi:hypothetical protein